MQQSRWKWNPPHLWKTVYGTTLWREREKGTCIRHLAIHTETTILPFILHFVECTDSALFSRNLIVCYMSIPQCLTHWSLTTVCTHKHMQTVTCGDFYNIVHSQTWHCAVKLGLMPTFFSLYDLLVVMFTHRACVLFCLWNIGCGGLYVQYVCKTMYVSKIEFMCSLTWLVATIDRWLQPEPYWTE